jgi:hypothetical protein
MKHSTFLTFSRPSLSLASRLLQRWSRELLPMNSVAQQKCVTCSCPCSAHCIKCKQAYYCSKACQKKDRPIHKLFCDAYSDFSRSDRPTDDHFLACLFPVHGNRPQMTWLSCQWQEDEDGRHQLPHFDPGLGIDHETPIQYNQTLQQRLPNTLCICYRDSFLIDGSETNKSILSIMTTSLGPRHDWRGPIVAYSRRGPGLDPPMCRDIDMKDLRHISDYFLCYGVDATPVTDQSDHVMIRSVRINCSGDQKIHARPRFEAVEVSTTGPIFTTHYTSDIAERVGIPIYTRSCASDSPWTNERHSSTLEGRDPFTNQDATFLHLCCNPNTAFDP